MFAIVVDMPAMNGNAPHTPQPIDPRKNSFQNSLLKDFLFFIISLKKKGSNNKKTVNHLQKAKEIGGTYSTPPRATIMLDAMKTGCINNNK